MKVLIIGNGGRESAIAKKLSEDKRISQMFFAKGNATTENLGKNLPYDSVAELRDFALREKIDAIKDIQKDKLKKLFGKERYKKYKQLKEDDVF
jgi:phosphoribosylamine-glycine ligase